MPSSRAAAASSLTEVKDMPTAVVVVVVVAVGDKKRKGNKVMDNTVNAPVKQKVLPSSSTKPWVFRN